MTIIMATIHENIVISVIIISTMVTVMTGIMAIIMTGTMAITMVITTIIRVTRISTTSGLIKGNIASTSVCSRSATILPLTALNAVNNKQILTSILLP